MKKIVKILLLVVLLACIVFEGFLLFKKDKKTDVEEKKKIVANAATTYTTNGLKYKLTNKDNIYYYKIHGLKDEELEDKINNNIYERCKEVNDKYKDPVLKNVVAEVVGSFSNVLSIKIGLNSISEYELNHDQVGVQVVYDSLNIDLNTGKELTIDDITLSIEGLRTPIVDNVTDDAIHRQGFIIFGPNPNPHYERVEDAVISVMNKFNAKNFKFVFDSQTITLYFSDIYINTPELVSINEYNMDEYTEEEIEHIRKTCKDQESDYEELYFCEDAYESTYDITIPFYYLADDLIVYDSFLSKESLFVDDGDELRKYTHDKKENSYVTKTMYEEDNNIYDYGGLNEYSFDFTDGNYCSVPFNTVKGQILKDIKDKIDGEYKVFSIYIDPTSLTKGCALPVVVTTYQLDKDAYQKYKNKIYTKRLLRDGYYYLVNNESKYGYSFLEDYEKDQVFLSYAYDDKTHELIDAYTMINPNFDLKKYIPDNWTDNKDELIKTAYITTDKNFKYDDRLGICIVFNYWGYVYDLMYKGQKVELRGDEDMDLDIEALLNWSDYEEGY